MTAFATIADVRAPVRIVLVGAGAMGHSWIRALQQSKDVELVGLVDLDAGIASVALKGLGITGVAVGTSVAEVAQRTHADAVLNVTVPEAHLAVNREALEAGLPVLCEKPIAASVAEAQESARIAAQSGQLLMASQSRRYYRSIALFREQVRSLGEIGALNVQFFKAPRFGGFREEMDHVLLLDMAIHQFDAARYILDRDPIAVYCHETNPDWSWYAHGSVASAIFEFAGGTTFTYMGSWCSRGQETSWNGSWRVSGADGTSTWDGDSLPVTSNKSFESGGSTADTPEEIQGALAEFVSSLRTGVTPASEVHSNLLSLAMVEAAIRSAETRQRVTIASIMSASNTAQRPGPG